MRGGRSGFVLVFLAFWAGALLVYQQAFPGPFYADDAWNVVNNAYVHELSAQNVAALLDPWGAPAKMTQNYAPVHLLSHAAEWSFFQTEVVGYRVVNVTLHALASTLLAALLLSSGVPLAAAVLAGAFFLLHPANVEAVAWIFQLKTTLAMVLALGALLLLERRPIPATLLFVAAILTKVVAVVALPVAGVLLWKRGIPNRWRWLAGWGAVLLVLAAVTFPIFRYTNAQVPPLHADLDVYVRTVMAIASRYLFMATTGIGVAVFHDVPRAESWSDPWWLASLPLLGLLGWRMLHALASRGEEGAYWLWAAASFAPVSQIFPFLHPMADRYLYFILPGLIGGFLLAAQDVLSRAGPRVRTRQVALAACALAGVLVASLAVRSHAYARLWSSPVLLQDHSVRRYPNGQLALGYRALQAAAAGDAQSAVAALRLKMEHGDISFRPLLTDPAWIRIRQDARFQELIQEMARRWVAIEQLYPSPSQIELRGFAQSHWILGQYAEAEALLERALEVGGLNDADTKLKLVEVRRLQAVAETSASSSQ